MTIACSVCGRSFASNRGVAQHNRKPCSSALNRATLQCEMCSLFFKGPRGLSTHLATCKRQHAAGERRADYDANVCECGFTSINITTFMEHVNVSCMFRGVSVDKFLEDATQGLGPLTK
jgi:hypothetical protein